MVKVSFFTMVTNKEYNLLKYVLPNILKVCNYDFFEVILLFDGVKSKKIYSLAKYYQDIGLITHLIDVDRKAEELIAKKYFKNGVIPKFKNNYAFLYGIESCKGEYICHLDIDVICYSKLNVSWVSDAIEILDKEKENIFSVELPPPLPCLNTNNALSFSLRRDMVRYNIMISRMFLAKSSILKSFSNLPDKTKEGKLSLEELWTEKAIDLGYYRITLATDKYYCIHLNRKFPYSGKLLRWLVSLFESGLLPKEQCRERLFNLILFAWIKLVILNSFKAIAKSIRNK